MPTLHAHVLPQTQEDLDNLKHKKAVGPTNNKATLGFQPMGAAPGPKARPTNPPQTAGPTPRRAPVTPAMTAMTGRSTREAKLAAHRRVPDAVPKAVSR